MEEPNVSNILDNASKAYIVSESIKPLRDATTTIKSMFSGPVPIGKEVEFRFGTMSYDQKKGRNDFFPGLDGIDYLELFNRLRIMTYYNFTTIFSKVENYEEGRIITYYSDFRMNIPTKTLYQKKKNIDNFDMKLMPYSLRISLADEKELEAFKPKNAPKYQKIQTRYIFDFKYFEFHLSEIKNKDGLKYEVEVEVKDVSRLSDIVKASLMILTEKISIFGDDTYKNKLLYYQSKLKSRYYYIGKKDDTFFDNKPRSISYANAKSISNGYAVTNKLDGVHYNLVFSRDFAYLVNATEVLLVSNPDDEYTNFWKNVLDEKTTVLDGELVIDNNLNVVFHIFDALVIKDENISGVKDFLKRIEMAKPIVENYNSSMNKILKIKIKEIAYTENIGQDILKIFKYMVSKYGREEYAEINDGIVFVSAKGAYNDYIYKWKFPSRITMDGIIKFKEEKDGMKIYSFKFYDEDKSYKSLNYKGKDIDMVVSMSSNYGKVLKDDMIVEAKASVFTNDIFFVIDRIRKDKIRPNFIGVAEKTLKDVLNPMNETELLKYFNVSSSEIKDYIKSISPQIKDLKVILEKKEEIREVPKSTTLKPIAFVRAGESKKIEISEKEEKKEEKKEQIVIPIVVKETQEQIETKNAVKSLLANKSKSMEVSFTDEIFTRIGIIGDGSCFIHSILFSIYKYGYTKISTEEKYKYAALVRKKMSDDLEFGTWSLLGKGEVAKMLTDVAMSRSLSGDNQKEYEDAVMKFKPSSDRLFYDYIKYMRPKFPNIVEVAKKEHKKYKDILNSCAYFNDSMFEYASMFFDVNIFIVRDLSRKIEPICLDFYKPERSSIFVLHIDSKYSRLGPEFSSVDHFEVLSIKSDAGLETLFDNDSKLVQDAYLSMTQMAPVEKKELVVVEVPTKDDVNELRVVEIVEEVKKVEEKVSEKLEDIIRKEIERIDSLYFMRNKDRKINIKFI